MENPFLNRDILSTLDFTKEEIEFLFDISDKMEEIIANGSKVLAGKIMASMFLEPSTRTRLGFDTAMKLLGGNVIGYSDWQRSSIKKGETFSDTLHVIENYANLLVLRMEFEGAAKYAAEILNIPVINAGSGSQEHPTQSFLDVYTIRREHGSLDGLTIGICGDLKYGRAVHSLLPLLANYDVKVMLFSPPELKMRREDRVILEAKGTTFEEMPDLDANIPSLDVLYMTRMQRERFPSEEEYNRIKEYYVLTKSDLKDAKDDMILMHPLPRIHEIDVEVDDLPQAKYFKQPRYGLYVRMALLGLISGVF